MRGSRRAPHLIDQFTGLYAEIGVIGANESLPNWWRFGTGQCRAISLATNFDFTNGPFTCTDFYAGQAQGGMSYDTAFGGLDRARIRIEAAVPYDNRGALDPSWTRGNDRPASPCHPIVYQLRRKKARDLERPGGGYGPSSAGGLRQRISRIWPGRRPPRARCDSPVAPMSSCIDRT